jgi:hypothetical protein
MKCVASFSSTERAFYSKSTHDNLFYQAGDCWQKLTAQPVGSQFWNFFSSASIVRGLVNFFYLLTDRSE